MLGGMFGEAPAVGVKPANNPNFDFFNYCGITRPVKLYTTPWSYVEDISLTDKTQLSKNLRLPACLFAFCFLTINEFWQFCE